MEFPKIFKPKGTPEKPAVSDENKAEVLKDISQMEEMIKDIEKVRDELKTAIDENDIASQKTNSKKLKEMLSEAKTLKRKMEGVETMEPINATYAYKNEKGEEITENIEIDIEKKLEQSLSFYKYHNIDIPEDFEETIKDIWEKNREAMQEQIEKLGFDEVLIVPANIKLDDAFDKEMTKGYEKKDGKDGMPTYWGVSKEKITSDERSEKPRIILVHKNKARDIYKNPEVLPVLKETLGKKLGAFKPEEGLTAEEYFIFQRQYFEETGKHLDEEGYTWLGASATDGGSRVVRAGWYPGDGQLIVSARVADYSYPSLGCRLSRRFS